MAHAVYRLDTAKYIPRYQMDGRRFPHACELAISHNRLLGPILDDF